MAWTRGPTIGRGSTAAVSLATTCGGDLFAVKSSDLASSALLQKEECLISQLCSPHIIRCLGSDVTSEDGKLFYNLFLEYSDGGSLSDFIRKRGSSLDENSIRFHAQQILLGVEYLHRRGLVHCDIKAQNILVGSDGTLKIADFGCAKWEKSGAESFSGTPAYMAPEVARGEEQSFPADIWAVGCTVVEMATGSHTWPEMKDPASALYRIAFSGDVPEFPSWFSGEARDFLGKCLTRDSQKRWTAAELLQHPFLELVEESCGGVREFMRRSPTSVTDQGFWDAVEVSESCENPTEIESSSSDSPRRRIGALVGNADPRRLDFGEESHEWVSVRANQVEECEELNQDFEDLNQGFGDLIEAEHAIMDEEGIAPSNLVIMEDSWFDCNCTSPVTCRQSVQHITYSELSDFKIMIMELFLDQDFRPLISCQCSSLDLYFLAFLKEADDNTLIHVHHTRKESYTTYLIYKVKRSFNTNTFISSENSSAKHQLLSTT